MITYTKIYHSCFLSGNTVIKTSDTISTSMQTTVVTRHAKNAMKIYQTQNEMTIIYILKFQNEMANKKIFHSFNKLQANRSFV